MLPLLGAAGLTLILVRGSAFAWLRRVPGLRSLLSCAMCAGFWTGVAEGFFEMRVAGWPTPWYVELHELLVPAGVVSVLALLADFAVAALDEVATKSGGGGHA